MACRIFMPRVPMVRFHISAVLLAMLLAPKATLAEIDLGGWQTHAMMAEQGAVCGAFADLMAMQTLVDEKVGRLWSERRAYSGSVIKHAAELEGRTDIDDSAIDELLNRYSMWLLNNLAYPDNDEFLDPVARDAASDMIGDVCTGLYAQADRAILEKHPSLGACSPGRTPLPVLSGGITDAPASCETDSAILAATAIKQAEDTVADMLARLQQAQEREDSLSNEIAILRIDKDRLLREIDANRISSSKIDKLTVENEQLRRDIASLRQELATHLDEQRQLANELQNLQTRHERDLLHISSLTDELATARTAVNRQPGHDGMMERIARLVPTRAVPGSTRAENDNQSNELRATRTPNDFVAQLGTFRSRSGALSEITRIRTHFPDSYALTTLTITPIRLHDGSSAFRISTGDMPAEDAQRLCAELWGSMVSCMLRAAP